MEQTSMDFRSVFNAIPGNNVLLSANSPDFTVIAVSQQFVELFEIDRNTMVGKSFTNACWSFYADAEPFVNSLERAIIDNNPDRVANYTLPGWHTPQTWTIQHIPIEQHGTVEFIIHTITASAPELQTDILPAAQQDEAKYRRLFESMDQGFCLMDILFDNNKHPYDYRFIEVNSVFEAQSGLLDPLGRTARELVPNLEQHWFELYGNVALTGQSKRFTQHSAAMGKWFEVYAFKSGGAESTQVALLFTDITERKQVENALQQSQNRLSKALSIETVGTVFFDREGKINDANDAFIRMSGSTRQLFNEGTIDWGELTPDEFMPVTRRAADQLMATGQNVPFEKEYRRADGSRWWGLFAGKRLSENEFVGFILDVSESKKAEEAVRRSEEQVRALIESAPFPIGVYIGREMRIAFLNQSIIDVWGKGSDIIGKTYAEVLPELGSQNIYQRLDAVYDTGKAYHAKNQEVHLVVDGILQRFYFNYSFTPLFDANGKVYGIMNTAADVTDLNIALQRVQQSEQNFRNMILQAPVAMCILLGTDHVIDVANDAMVDLWGKTRDSVMGKPVFVALPDAREQGLEDLLNQVFTSGETFSAAERPVQLLRNGTLETVYQNFVYQAHKSADGAILGVLVISIDVTEQVMARKKIEEAEQRARLAIESADLGTYDLDIVSDSAVTSERFKQIWTMDNPASRQDYLKLIHPDDLHARALAFEQAYENGNLNYEVRIMPERQSMKWIKVRGMMLRDQKGAPARMLGVVQDITEQKLFAEELKKRVAEQTAEILAFQKELLGINIYFHHIIDTFDSALAALVPVFDGERIVDFSFKMTNRAYEKYSRMSAAAIKDRKVGDVFPGYHNSEAFGRYVNAYIDNTPSTWEMHYNADGLDVHLIVTATRLNDEVLVNITDVTELKKLQLDLIRKINQLEQLNKNLEDFAYAASHDMKEPIRKILVFVERLKESFTERSTPAEQRYFERIEFAAHRMKTLVEDLLSYSEVSNHSLLEDRVNLDNLVQQVLGDLDLEIEQRGAQIHVDKLFNITGHRRHLQQAFQNLLGNALKYSVAGKPPVINITCTTVHGHATGRKLNPDEMIQKFYKISVTDNGIGFDQVYAEKIFNVFTRLHSDGEYRGTGVGLAIVLKVIQNHQGHVWAESQPGQGSSFHLLLPFDSQQDN